MGRKLLIDATQQEETRVAVVDGDRLDEFDNEQNNRRSIKGNIYLARVTRVEPALQSAFLEFGQDRHGFLPFKDIHPDYYHVPTEDQDAPLVEIAGAEKRRQHYRIQEVIRRRQIMLVQVVKEERGNKGPVLTTYLSLPGRYCVLMPNAGNRHGGVSKKIQDQEDRKRLREIWSDIDMPGDMSFIVRTAGEGRNKQEIKRDCDYLKRTWNEIYKDTMNSIAPALIFAEGDIINRTLRDVYNKDIEEVIVAGEDAYKQAKAFMRNLMPSHTKKIKLHDNTLPLFYMHGIDQQIDTMMHSKVYLPSGGYLVINHTEALVAVDVNSGKAVKERNIEETAYRTNLEAAEELARQLRLRDLSGIIVIDFIDMFDKKHIHSVERKFRESTVNDRARLQIGHIGQFGLLEISRQRLKTSLLELHTISCPNCEGNGVIRSVESVGSHLVRVLEENIIEKKPASIILKVPAKIDLYLLNDRRRIISELEEKYKTKIYIESDVHLISPAYDLQIVENVVMEAIDEPDLEEIPSASESTKETKPKKKRYKKKGAKLPLQEETSPITKETASDAPLEGQDAPATQKQTTEGQTTEGQTTEDSSAPKPKRRYYGKRHFLKRKRNDN